MKLYIASIFLFFCSDIFSQNLVINGGLEVLETDVFTVNNVFNNEHVSGKEIAPGWHSVTPATPDFFNSPFLNDTTNNVLVMPLKGKGRIGIIGGSCQILFGTTQYKEYITGKLSQRLEKGKNYEVSFYITHDPRSKVAINNFGVLFSDSSIRYEEQRKLPYKPDIVMSKGEVITFKAGWIKVSEIYTAKGGEQHLVIGSFSDLSCIPLQSLGIEPLNEKGDQRILNNAFYYVDEVSVIPTDFSDIKNSADGIILRKAKADRYLLVVDVSKSMADDGKLDLVKQSVLEVIADLPTDSEIGMITYHSNPKLLLPFSTTGSISYIQKSMDSLESGGSTNFSGAIQFAYQYLKNNPSDGKEMVVVFTDGVFSVESNIHKLIKDTNKDSGTGFSVMQFGDSKNGDLLRLVSYTKGDYMENSNTELKQKLETVFYEKKTTVTGFIPIELSKMEEETGEKDSKNTNKNDHDKNSRKNWMIGIGGGLLAASVATLIYFLR